MCNDSAGMGLRAMSLWAWAWALVLGGWAGRVRALCAHPLRRGVDAVALRATTAPNRAPSACEQMAETLRPLALRDMLVRLCGEPEAIDVADLFESAQLLPEAPTINQFVIGNPAAFLAQPAAAHLYGCDLSTIATAADWPALARQLPVLYIADTHSDYGTLGLQLNILAGQRMGVLFPSLRSLRDRPVFQGGATKQGATFTMVHRKAGFPENRPWRTLPGNAPTFRLFFSPDVAMANELCATRDAEPQDFKFFQHSTLWTPGALELEHRRGLWLTVRAPVTALFADLSPRTSLWHRFAASLLLRGGL